MATASCFAHTYESVEWVQRLAEEFRRLVAGAAGLANKQGDDGRGWRERGEAPHLVCPEAAGQRGDGDLEFDVFPTEKAYFCTAGEITITTEKEEIVFKPNDSISTTLPDSTAGMLLECEEQQ